MSHQNFFNQLFKLIIQPPDDETSRCLVSLGFQKVPTVPQLLYQNVFQKNLAAIFRQLSETLCDKMQASSRFLLTSSPLDSGSLLLEFLQAKPLNTITESVKHAWFLKVLLKPHLFFKYQPIFHLPSGLVAAYECLARSTDDQGKCISGAKLIESAVSTELTVEFDELARTTCIDAIASFEADHHFFINVLPNAIIQNPKSLEQNWQQVLALGLRPEQIVFELTEIEVLTQNPELGKLIKRMREWGFGIAVDDLCGCVSVDHYVMEFRPDLIKLDRRLIQGCSKFTLKQTLIKSFLQSAHYEGIKVVAEGLENAEDIEFCKNLGVDYGQGFGLALPEMTLRQQPLDSLSLLISKAS